MPVYRGEIHNYLGMDMDWSKDGKVTISMTKHLYQILDEFIEEISKRLNCQKNLRLFFHHTVAKLLFILQAGCVLNVISLLQLRPFLTTN